MNVQLNKTNNIDYSNFLITTRLFIKRNHSLIEILSINTYATVTTDDGVLIIGGFDNSRAVADVALFDGTNWFLMGLLHGARTGHNAVVNADKLFVIGGEGPGWEYGHYL